MELAARSHPSAYRYEEQVQLLVADDDRLARAQLASCARDAVEEIVVLEAEDGAEAIQLGLQHRPEIALLDVEMPRLGGVEAALTLRELQPQMRLGLQTDDPLPHRERARAHQLPLFNKVELGRTLAWLRAQVHWSARTEPEHETPRKRSFVCSACRYGVLRSAPPVRCPMCQAENAWLQVEERPPVTLAAR